MNIEISRLFETRWRFLYRIMETKQLEIGGKARSRREGAGALSPVAGFGGRQESIERATLVVYRKGPVAREEEQRAARVPRRPSREHYAPGTRRIFATVSPRHARTRYESRLRSRGYGRRRRKRQRKRRGSRPRMHTHARVGRSSNSRNFI